MRKLLKTTLVGLSSLLIVALAIGLLLTSEPGENIIKEWIENRLTAEIGLPVSIARFETNLWSHATIDTLIAASSEDQDGPPTLFVGHIRVDYSIPELLGEVVTLRTLLVDNVTVAITLDSLGQFGIPALDAPALEPGNVDNGSRSICIDSLSLARVDVSYSDRQFPYSVALSEITLSARGKADGSFAGQLFVGNAFAVYDNQALDLHDLELAASINRNALRVDNLRAECEGLVVKAHGDIGLDDAKDLSLAVTVDGTLDTLVSLAAEYLDLLTLKSGYTSIQCRVEGSLDFPIVSLDASLGDLIFQDLIVQSAEFSAEYREHQLMVDTFLVMTLEGTMSGKAGIILDTPGSSSLSLAIDRIDLASLWQAIYAEPSPYQGTIRGNLDARGDYQELTSWTIDARIAGDSLRYLNRPVPELTCTARIESGRSSFALIHGSDEIHAEIDFGADSLHGAFNVSVPDITALSRFVDQPEVYGSLRARGTIGGAYANPTFHSTVHGAEITYFDFPVDSIMAELSYVDSTLEVIDLWCSGRLDSIDTEHPPFGLDSIHGSIAYEGRLLGSMDRLSGEITAQLNEPRYASYAADSLSVEARLNGSQLAITELRVSRGDLGARLSATYDTLTAIGAFDLQLHPLSTRSGSDRDRPEGAANTRENYGSINGDFSLPSLSNLSAAIHGSEIWIGLSSEITGDTTVTDGNISFDLAVEGPYATPAAVFSATARSVKMSGHFIDSVTAHIRLAKELLILDSLSSHALGQRFWASGQLGLSVSKDGVFEITDSAPVTVEFGTTDFDLSVLKGLILPAGELTGIASTTLRADGTLSAPHLDGWLNVDDGRVLLQEGGFPVSDIQVAIRFADSIFTIDRAAATVMDRSVVATGLLTAAPPYESAMVDLSASVGEVGRLVVGGIVSDSDIQLEVQSDSLNLAVLQPFVTELDSLRGRVGCRLVIIGQPAAPNIDGHLEINGLSLQSPRYHVNLNDGHAYVRFDRSQVFLDSLLCSLNGGKLALSGTIAHDHGTLQDIALTLSANHVSMDVPGSYSIAVDSATLSYGKRLENYVLDGDIVLGEARLTAGLRPTSILPWVQSLETVDMVLPELVARSRLDVRIRESDKLWIDNNLARIRLRAELGVIGTPLRPNFTGQLKIEEGYLLYLDRRFSVNTGALFFNDPARFNPDVSLDASTKVTVYRRTSPEPYTVFIRAEGLLDQLQYGLHSEPPLDKPDIVALLTLGATRTDLAGGDNGANNGLTGVLKDRAAMLTSQRASGYLSRKASTFFGFDEFTIQGNLFQFDNSWGPQLVASKRLSRRVDFTYSTTVGHLNDQSVRLGYRLTPRFSLQGETDRQGRSGIDLRYGFTYR